MAEPQTSLNEELTEAVLRWARPTTPSELQARGVSRVHAISLSRVGALLEKAVNRTLIRRTVDGLPDDALALSSSAREEFLRLARGVEPRESTRIAERASSTLERLRTELTNRRAALASEALAPHTAHDLGQTVEVEERIRALFVRFSSDCEVPIALERQVLSVVRQAFDGLQQREREARQRESRRELDLLERRITKLQALLAESETELQRARDGASVDAGVASIYDRVQGLSGVDVARERKGALMSAIFAANLELRQATATARRSAVGSPAARAPGNSSPSRSSRHIGR
jgi:hypothetical protein